MIIDLRDVSNASSQEKKKTRVRCVMRVDLGGNIPRGIFRKTVGQTALMAFKAVRAKAVEGQRKEDEAMGKGKSKSGKKKDRKSRV